MEWFKAVVELVRSVAWPVLIGAVIIAFRAEIRERIPNTRKLGPMGAEFDPGRQSAAAVRSTTDLRDLPGLTRSPAIANVETHIHRALEAEHTDAPVDLLIRHLAQSRLETIFERVYRLIFESQIEGLRRIVAAQGTVPKSAAAEYFNEVKLQHPDFYNDATFDQWLVFLVNAGLVDMQPERIKITDFGRDFLAYVTAQQLPKKTF